VDVNAQDGYYGNALQAASLGGHEKIVQLLLEKGADIKKAPPQVAAESDVVPNEATDVSTPEATADDSSESGYEVMSDGDERRPIWRSQDIKV